MNNSYVSEVMNRVIKKIKHCFPVFFSRLLTFDFIINLTK
jgi:hypothetical protein